MEEKTCIVTGSSSGIGKGTALLLAKLGAEVIMLSRDNKRGRLAFKKIKHASKNGNVQWIPTDLSSQQSVHNFVKVFKNKHKKLDVLFNCAGVLLKRQIITVDGIECMFATNYIGHYLLTNLLFDYLRAGTPSLVVTISGRRHKMRTSEEASVKSIDFDNLQKNNNFNIAKASKQAVLAKIIFTYEIARKWRRYGIYACTLCPGSTRTNFFNNLPWRDRIYYNVRFFTKNAQTPEKAAKHLINLARSTNYQELNKKYYEASSNILQEARSSDETYDKDLAKRLWDISEKLVGQCFSYK